MSEFSLLMSCLITWVSSWMWEAGSPNELPLLILATTASNGCAHTLAFTPKMHRLTFCQLLEFGISTVNVMANPPEYNTHNKWIRQRLSCTSLPGGLVTSLPLACSLESVQPSQRKNGIRSRHSESRNSRDMTAGIGQRS